MNRESAAVVHHVQAGGKSAGAALSRSARVGRLAITPGGNVLEQTSADLLRRAVTVTPGGAEKEGFLAVPPASHPVHGPAHSGAGGVGWNSEASRQEPGTLESVQGRVGGAR